MDKLIVEEGFPLSENGCLWVFGSNLIKYLDGSFILLFSPNKPVEGLENDSMGSVELRTEDGVDSLFTISNVKRDHFYQLAKLFEREVKCAFHKKVEELAKCKKDCHTAGHYECWRDNCDCICHAARRVLGIALPESYMPVPE